MKVYRIVAISLTIAVAVLNYAGKIAADTITMNDGKEIKGIVVEDYKDRLVFSTADGEMTIMKSEMRDLSYDSEEDNLIKLADQAADRRDYSRAMGYYEMAMKQNPASKAARQGMAYLRGNLFRQEESMKFADIQRQQDIEMYGGRAPLMKESDGIDGMLKKLESTTGMRVSVIDGAPKIESIRPDSPASEAGLRPGDLLISVWSKLTGYLSMPEILDLLINRSAIEIRCEFERSLKVHVNRTMPFVARPEELIDATLAMELDGLTLSMVKPTGVSDLAGLRKGDLVTSIDGLSTRYMPLKKAIDLIRKRKGAAADLTIRRKATIWRQ